MTKKILQGTVESTKMNRTVVVSVARLVEHPLYKKRYLSHARYKAHYEGSDLAKGDVVQIEESRPLSKEKRWLVISKVSEGRKTKEPPKTHESEETAS
jgi:small subunit ribosomal protein S17